ncbi:hypothetical protein D0Y65_048327 [Glycine soja]|uniref:Uncharacterized protein n=1 Tax=Glycine soja TaxID=3848 RepID=A0A445FSI7_GLYSO|nr:hypothetical protein D0Y65_048327 [Glycine soja]
MATLDFDVTVFLTDEASSSGGPSSSTKKPKRFDIKKWNVVSLWAWGASLSMFSQTLICHDVAPCGACRPWIFFINRVLCFLNINGSGIEKEEIWLETPLQGEDESRRSSQP